MNVFLTGASAGFGRATAELLTREGYEVWGTSRSIGKLPTWPRFHPLELDLASPDSIQAATDQACQEAGQIDILINNAGEGVLGPLEAFTPQALRQQLEILVVAPHQLMQRFLPGMRARNAGIILNVSSLAAQFPVPYLGPYSAAKAALANYTATLRLELTGTQVRVLDLQPGDFATSFGASTQTISEPIPEYYRDPMRRASQVMDKNMAQGPAPEIAARRILELLRSDRPRSPLTIGTFFQAKLSPFLAGVLPPSIMEESLRHYYQLPSPPVVREPKSSGSR